MAGNPASGSLSGLMSETEEILARLVSRSSLVSSVAVTPLRAARSTRAPGGAPIGSSGTLLGRDERELRALAKEIRRLISEDRRRGLPL